MKFLDLTFASPADNLACDEVLLNRAEAGGADILRFWEPNDCFVVVGYANKVATEVNVAACSKRNVPIFRRCSGGGTVLQGPGCLNYALVLHISSHASLANISCTNRFIMERNRQAIELEIRNQDAEARISICGHTDLALVSRVPSPDNPRKFSGNSQRRHRDIVMFHGTFLLNFDVTLVDALLPMPSRQPDYREQRSHSAFLTNLNLCARRVKAAMQTAWEATSTAEEPSHEEILSLAREKYSTRAWNFKL